MNRQSRNEFLVFGLLLAFGVLGRWAQPAWNFTPLVAVTALGGFYFRSWLPAILLPVTMLAMSDLLVDAHDNAWVQLSVYAMTIVPLALGRLASRKEGWRRAACWGACGFVPAMLFFVVTNFVVWKTKSLYEPNLGGLMDCYAKALPFLRPMIAGDVCYIALMVGCLAAADLLDSRDRAELRVKK
jgi:hypothetical protein